MLLMLDSLGVVFLMLTSETAFGRARGLGVWFLPATLLAIFATVGWMLLTGKGQG